jgi:hypothetical protein
MLAQFYSFSSPFEKLNIWRMGGIREIGEIGEFRGF